MDPDTHLPRTPAETVKEKKERLRAARLQAERDKDARIERANRMSAARRKVLGKPGDRVGHAAQFGHGRVERFRREPATFLKAISGPSNQRIDRQARL